MNNSLIAPCGINCGVCLGYLREKNKCPGCRFFNKSEPVSIAKCKIRNCEEFKGGKKKFCFECEKIPCSRLKQLDKRYRTRYGVSMLANLEEIKYLGVKKFEKLESKKWKCEKCGGVICIHRKACLKCGG